MNASGIHDASQTDALREHIPVMLKEVLEALSPGQGNTFIDGTLGAGGYTRAILETGANVLAIDRDPDAIEAGRKIEAGAAGRLQLALGKFSRMDKIVREMDIDGPDGIVLDVGVSSMQIDQAERGFSFQKDGPLDMRMAQTGVSAFDVVNYANQSDLTRIIGILGEEKKASRIARAIAEIRSKSLFTGTVELARLIEKTIGRKPGAKIHPATRTFQALRIFVNRELEELAYALFAAERLLKNGGRLVVVTFHSLEDRIVKRFFADRSGASAYSRHLPETATMQPTFTLHKRGAIKSSDEETHSNPRARSAKLRVGVRTNVLPRKENMEIFGLPNLTDLASLQSGVNLSGGADV